MSKPLRLASLVVICGLCVAVAMETRTLFALRTHAAAETRRALAAEEALGREREELARLKEQDAIYKAESEALRRRLADVRPGTAPAAEDAQTAAATPPPSGAAAPEKPVVGASKDFAKALGKMFSDPDMKKMMRTQQAMAVRTMYGDLAKELGLAPEQTEQVMQLLAERQMDLAERGMALMQGGKDSDPDGKAIADVKKNYDAQIQAALGDGYPAFQNYEKSLPDHLALQQYQQQFSSGGQALSDDQRTGLLRIMSEERAGMPPSEFNDLNGDPAAQMKALASDEKVHDLFASQEELNRRVLARAATVLSAEQLSSFTDMQARMLQMQQMGVKMSRNMFGDKK